MSGIINIHGAPSSGKSVLAAELFASMKKVGYQVEIVVERTKELIAEKNLFGLADEVSIYAEKRTRIARFLNTPGTWVITDSPLFNSWIYGASVGKHFQDFVLADYESLHPTQVILGLDSIYDYEPIGRNPDKDAAMKTFEELNEVITREFKVIPVTGMSPDYIIRTFLPKE